MYKEGEESELGNKDLSFEEEFSQDPIKPHEDSEGSSNTDAPLDKDEKRQRKYGGEKPYGRVLDAKDKAEKNQ